MSKEINSRTIQNVLLLEEPNSTTFIALYLDILHFMFLFSLFVFVRAASHYFRIWTGSIWTGQVPALF
jgi:hypothetical protein